jgi:hypothetical protein
LHPDGDVFRRTAVFLKSLEQLKKHAVGLPVLRKPVGLFSLGPAEGRGSGRNETPESLRASLAKQEAVVIKVAA